MSAGPLPTRLPEQSPGWWRLRERAEHGLLFLPYLTGALLLLVIPGLLTFALAFTYYDGISPPVWWGVRNFTMFYIDPLERIAIANSLTFTALAVPLRLLGALGLALLLSASVSGLLVGASLLVVCSGRRRP